MTKQDILIVEDSPAITMLLQNYLQKLGFSSIKSCDTGSNALVVFKELIAEQKNPIVFLDYQLPDMDARSILTQILAIQPNARIILETASDKDEQGIKELIRLGVYQYIEKPIRFEELKSVVEILENEQSFFDPSTNSTSSESQKNTQNISEKIDFVLNFSKTATINFLQELTNLSKEDVLDYLKQLENKGKVVSLETKKEISCNQCDSVRIKQTFYCPSCKSPNFKLGKLIEHYDCGNITEENTYVDDKCPKCKKIIKAIGVDYRIMKNHYICNSCNGISSEISSEYVCQRCENRFQLEDASWKSSPNYKVLNI